MLVNHVVYQRVIYESFMLLSTDALKALKAFLLFSSRALIRFYENILITKVACSFIINSFCFLKCRTAFKKYT